MHRLLVLDLSRQLPERVERQVRRLHAHPRSPQQRPPDVLSGGLATIPVPKAAPLPRGSQGDTVVVVRSTAGAARPSMLPS